MKRLLILSILIFAVVLNISADENTPPTIAVMDVVATNTTDVKSQIIYEYIVDVVNRRVISRIALPTSVLEQLPKVITNSLKKVKKELESKEAPKKPKIETTSGGRNYLG